MLLIMNKTKKPEFWIDCHSKIGEQLTEKGINVRSNIMFHAGETIESIKQTLEYIFSQKWSKEFAATPMFLLPGTEIYNNFNYYRKEFGADYFMKNIWEEIGVFPIHPSSSLTFDNLSDISTTINMVYPNITPAFTLD